ncbi:MAG: hypothetical protein HGB03_03130 [Candidatus Yonathbacteria bacterium]|nr:hypothetical protein [Candidatus Yonathbacteria bacterium]NTW47374.1 hypothetical protein [Candidatus Yonathbacteria bacterium]
MTTLITHIRERMLAIPGFDKEHAEHYITLLNPPHVHVCSCKEANNDAPCHVDCPCTKPSRVASPYATREDRIRFSK